MEGLELVRKKAEAMEEEIKGGIFEWINEFEKFPYPLKNSDKKGEAIHFWEEISPLINNAADPTNSQALKKLFCQRLQFGTAGLRGRMGCGFSQMNPITVMQTTQGVASYLETKTENRIAVIGYDARFNSRQMAHATAAVFISRGFTVHLEAQATVPTPLLAKAVLHFKAACGVMITASHNPRADNGYKLYLGNGRQILPDEADEISAQISKNLKIGKEVAALLEDCLLKNKKNEIKDVKSVFGPYCEEFMKDYCFVDLDKVVRKSDLKIVYTAMHGVGGKWVKEIVQQQMGLPNLYIVDSQFEEDGSFPTVCFPNPEEKGALGESIKKADLTSAPLIIANDPDADRFAAAEKINGKWHQFSGDELGILFADFLHRHTDRDPRSCMYTTTAVSSRWLEFFAHKNNYVYAETLTGFKWIMAEVLQNLHHPTKPLKPLLSYEEALGYCIGSMVMDKDGISAAGVFVQLACELYGQGKTIGKRLEEMRSEDGVHATNNSYFFCQHPPTIDKIFTQFRNQGKYTQQIGKFAVKGVRDATLGVDTRAPDRKCALPLCPDNQMVTIYFENGAVITLRTSGTEPKIKWYAELRGPTMAEAGQMIDEIVEEFVAEVLHPEKYDIKRG